MTAHGRVLLVSSIDDDRSMYGHYLRHHRVDVHDLGSPEQALEFLDHDAVDAIVTELVFARRSIPGPEFIAKARAQVDDATSIIVVSGFVRRKDRDVAREAGADTFLNKPALPRDVLYQVRRALVARTEAHRLEWNWPAAPEPKPFVERRTYTLDTPLIAAADHPRRVRNA